MARSISAFSDAVVAGNGVRNPRRLRIPRASGTDPTKALAIAKAYAERIDLLVTDVIMPQMNGRELAGRLRVLRPDLKILYMSGYMDRDLKLNAVFLRKQFAPEWLAAAVQSVIEGHVKPIQVDDGIRSHPTVQR
jgi:CheY-like chemotaxis protein